MSEAVAVEDMSREDLEDRVETLEERLDELEQQVDKNADKPDRLAVNHILNALVDEEITDFTAAPLQHKDAVEEFGRMVQTMNKRLNRVEDLADEEQSLSGDPNVENWQAIVEKARNLQGHQDHQAGQNRVKLYVKQIMGAVGCSDTWASELIEAYGADPREDSKGKRGTDWQEHKKITTSRQTDSSNVQQKALYIDMDVWGEDA